MVRNIFYALVLLLLFQCSPQNNEFVINGSFKIPAETKLYLKTLGVDEAIKVDSAISDKTGAFELKGFCSEPSLYVVQYLSEKIYLVIKPEDDIQIDIDNSLAHPSYYITGSVDSRLLRELIFEQNKVLEKITSISLSYEQSKQNSETFLQKKEYLDSLYDELLRNHKEYSKKFINDNPKSLATIFALYQNFGKSGQSLFDQFEDIDVFSFVDSNLTMLYPNTPAVIALNKDVTDIKLQLEHKKFSDKIYSPGMKAPAFKALSISGDSILLSDFKNKPVVYLFFASWNSPSAQEVKELNELYEQYRYRGLKIVGISFDTLEEKLLAFAGSTNIKFPIICDYKYWESELVKQFGIRAIPEIILLDKNHIVFSREIKASELKQILQEWRQKNMF
ncbi:MAG: AhpC/TSA family protein [Bacteroidales bacterium]|nr:AhpC/TSA family protein [Bacteroidales bacterium]MBN2818765.1 AhpC/TSA family protein [Bacteroidales bacterium]